METTKSGQSVFVTAQIDQTGNRGRLLGGVGSSKSITGELRTPDSSLVLWRVIERVEVEKGLESRRIEPSTDGLAVSYAYQIRGGGGGLFPLDEPGHFKAELVAVFAPAAFLPSVGHVEIVSSSMPVAESPAGTKAAVTRKQIASPAQLEGRLIQMPDDISPALWYVEQGKKRLLESPTCGRLRFGDGWQRLIHTLDSVEDAGIVPNGSPLTVAEAAEGRLIMSWPAPEAYWVYNAQKRRIDNPASIQERFGEHWRIKLIQLRRADIDQIPEGEAIV